MTINYKDKKSALNEIRRMIKSEIQAAGFDEHSTNSNYMTISRESPLFGIAHSCINEYSKLYSARNSEIRTSMKGYKIISGQKPTEKEISGNSTRKGFQVGAVEKLESIFLDLDAECPRRINKEMSIDHVRTIYEHLKKRGY